MTSRPSGTVLPHLRRLLAGEPDDPQLLERFLRRRDEDAFAALVRRHGPMVLAVCRRLLTDTHDAEDAFQAVFLVLARKASSLGRPEHLGNWLYGVAYRTALKARSHAAHRRLREQPLIDVPITGGVADLVWRELRPALDEELERLPEKYRTPIVLCYLEGVSKRDAARRLGWPEGTLSTRLHRAREILRGRLTRRGLALSAGVIVVALSQGAAPAAVPVPLLAAASLVAAGRAATVPSPVVALAEGVIRAMWWNKVKLSAVLFVALLVAAGLGRAVLPAPAAPPATEEKAPAAAGEPKKEPVAAKTLRLDKEVIRVVWSPDGKLMASHATRFDPHKGASDEGLGDFFVTVKMWDAATGKEVVSLGELKNPGLIGLAFSPDGATLALSFFRQIEEGARFELWDARKGALRKTIEMDYGRVVPRIAFAPDGKSLAVLYAGDKDRDPKSEDLQGGARLFDVATGKAIRSIRGHMHMAISLAFSPDGKLLATGGYSSDADVRLWDVATGKEVRRIETGANVRAVAFAPDGKVLASGLGDGRVVLWDVATGKELRVLKGVADSPAGLTFSPDGRLLAAAGPVERDKKLSNEARLWDVGTGELLRSWSDTATSLAFTSDGRQLAILGRDGTVSVWDLKELVGPRADAKSAFGFGTLIDQIIKEKKTDEQAAEALFLAAVGRFPEERERKHIIEQLAKQKDRRDAMIDVVWTLINSKEHWAHLDALNSHDQRRILKKN
jgi:RNA polymerase sigma factor (sigma-70 family)